MPVSPNAIPASGPVSVAMLHAEFGLGYNLNAYKGLRMFNTANNSRRDIGSGGNAYVSMSDFRGYQATSPVVPGSRNYSSSTGDTLPLFNVLTITVWGGGGGGGSGSIKNAVYGVGADGNGGGGGNTSSIVNASTGANYASAGGGGGGGAGQRSGDNPSIGSDGTGYDGAYGGFGAGGDPSNNDGATGGTGGGRGGYGGKTVVVWNVDSNPSLLSLQYQGISITIGSGGGGGGAVTIAWPAFPYITQTGKAGSAGTAGYANISWY